MKLIDGDALKEIIANTHEVWHYTGVLAAITAAPTIDAVNVVRCKDCAESKPLEGAMKNIYCDECLFCTINGKVMWETDYCSEARRKRANEK